MHMIYLDLHPQHDWIDAIDWTWELCLILEYTVMAQESRVA